MKSSSSGITDGTYMLQMHSIDDSMDESSQKSKHMLIEVPENVLEAVLSGGSDTLTLNGPTKDSAAIMNVAGIPGNVFVMKACETSNTVLVGPYPKSPEQSLQTRQFTEIIESIPSKK